MRVRRKKHGAERLEKCSEYRYEPSQGGFESVYGNDREVHIEIGCGKGSFITSHAEAEPNTNFLAVERVSDVLVVCAEKIYDKQLKNVRFLCADAKELTELLPGRSVKRIYLNFSDPWPKKGYAKRRLTHSSFLSVYKKLLTPDGEIFFKTDNDGLFEFSLTELAENGFVLKNIIYDLHASELAESNIMTEYERNFSQAGIKIKYVEAYLSSSF